MTSIIIIAILVMVAAFASVKIWKDDKLVAGILAFAALVGAVWLGWSLLRGVTINLPEIGLNWPTFAGVMAATLLAVGSGTKMYRLSTIGIGFLVWFAYMAFDTSAWFLILGLVGVAALLAYSDENGRRWMALLAGISLFAGMLLGVNTANSSALKNANYILQQMDAADAHFTSVADIASNAPAGSADKILAEKVKELDGRTTKLEKRVTTLEGKVATITEDVTGTTVTTKTSTDKNAYAKALGNELTKAGFKPGTYTVNKIDKTIRPAAGDYPFGEPLNGKADLVKHLNGSSAADKANRELVTLGQTPEVDKALLSGEPYNAIQLTEPVCTDGNGYLQNGNVALGGKHCYPAGATIWIPEVNGVIVWSSAIVDMCVNSHLNTAPAPASAPQAQKVCPADSPRAGQMVGSGCYPQPGSKITIIEHKQSTPEQPPKVVKVPVVVPTPPKTTPPTTTPPKTPPTTTPPKTPPTTTPPTTPPSKPPVTTPPATTPPTVPPTTTPPTNPPTTPPKKDPSKDPAAQGNAGNGAGKNQDSGPGATTVPTHAPSEARNNPPAPAPTQEPTTAQQTTAPAPAPEASAPAPTNPATGCAPAPGATTC